LPAILGRAGYHTYLTGKLHVAEPGKRMGFDHIEQSETPNDRRETAHQRRNDYADWFHAHSNAPHTLFFGTMSNDRPARPFTLPEQLHHTNWVTERAADFLTRLRDPACPFFLHVSYWAPHQPLLPPQCYFDRYADNAWRPALGEWGPDRDPAPGLRLDAQRGPFFERDMREAAQGYYGLIDHVDDQLNCLLDRWSCSRLYDPDRPTWVIFSSDHGEQLGDHHTFRKSLPYEGSSHVPFFIASLNGASVMPGATDALVGLEDVLPTVCELAEIEPPAHLGPADGRSLAPLLHGGDGGRDVLHGECRWRAQHHRFLVRDRWKYIRFTATGEEQLFDLERDPREMRDRSGEEALDDVRAAMEAHRAGAATASEDADVAPTPCANRPPRAIWND
jgi:arylsulfatase A-like enzyme